MKRVETVYRAHLTDGVMHLSIHASSWLWCNNPVWLGERRAAKARLKMYLNIEIWEPSQTQQIKYFGIIEHTERLPSNISGDAMTYHTFALCISSVTRKKNKYKSPNTDVRIDKLSLDPFGCRSDHNTKFVSAMSYFWTLHCNIETYIKQESCQGGWCDDGVMSWDRDE